MMLDRTEQRVLWGLAVPASALTIGLMLVVTGWLVPATYPPNPSLFLPVWAPNCFPEPLEQLRYVLAVTLVAVVLWLAAAYAQRLAANPAAAAAWAGPWAGRWAFAVQGLLFAFVGAAVIYQEMYVRPFVDRPACGAVVILLTALALAWRYTPERWLRQRSLTPHVFAGRTCRALVQAAPWALAVAVAAVELAPGWIREGREFGCSTGIAMHYPVYMGEFAAAVNGATALVDFFPQYQNLLAGALAPVFRVVGFNIFTFSAAMTLLSLGLLMCFFGAFRLATGGSWRALLLFVPFVWMSMATMEREPGLAPGCDAPINSFTYLAAAPLRYLGPALTLAVLAYYLGRPGLLRLLALALTAGATALNNLDFGLPALVAAFLAVVFSSDAGPLPRGKTLLRTAAAFAGGAALVLAAFSAGVYLRTGRLPDFGMATAYQRAFAVNGFYMLPMPPFGLQWVLYITFLAAVARGLFDRAAPPARRALLLYAGIFGPGALMYYVGRSHPAVLVTVFPAWAFALLLLVWSCWTDLARPLRKAGWRALTPAPLLLMLGYAVMAGRYNERPHFAYQYHRLTTKRYAEDPEASIILGDYKADVQCLRRHTKPGEAVAVIAPAGHLAAAEAGVKNVFPFSCSNSVLLQAQLDAASRALRVHEVRTVVADQACEDVLIRLARLGYRRQYPESPLLWQRGSGEPAVAVWWGGPSYCLPNDLKHWCGPAESLTVFNPAPEPRRVALRLRCVAATAKQGALKIDAPSGPQSWEIDETGRDVAFAFPAPPGLTRLPLTASAQAAAPFCYRVTDCDVSEPGD